MYEAVMVYIKSMTFLIKYKKLTGFEKSKKNHYGDVQSEFPITNYLFRSSCMYEAVIVFYEPNFFSNIRN